MVFEIHGDTLAGQRALPQAFAVRNCTSLAPEKYCALNEVKECSIGLRSKKASHQTIRTVSRNSAQFATLIHRAPETTMRLSPPLHPAARTTLHAMHAKNFSTPAEFGIMRGVSKHN
jgi:hypothetical protein